MAVTSAGGTGLISSPGIGSGIDVNGIVSKLMSVEQRPITQLNRQEASYQAQISAYGSLNGALSSFRSATQALASGTSFQGVKASVGDTGVATVSANSKAIPASYSLEVSKLAQAQKLRSDGFSSATSVVGTGTLTIDFGTYDGNTFAVNGDKAATSVTIGAGQNTLSGVRDAINAANSGVTASIVNDGGANGYRLVLTGQNTGAANSIRLTVNDGDGNHTDASGLSKLAYDPTAAAGAGKNLSQLSAAQDATFTLDNLTVTSPTNVVTTAIEGVTLTLTKSNVANPTTINVSKDTGALSNAIKTFVQGYNDFNKTLSSLQNYDPKTKQGAILQGDTVARSIQNQIRTAFNGNGVHGSDKGRNLASIGITFDKGGQLNIDQTKLDKALSDNSQNVLKTFAQVGTTTDSQIEFASSTAKTIPGNYAVDISQLATQANGVSSYGNLTVTAGVNDELSVTIKGVSASIQLSSGAHTPASMANEIQTKINGVKAFSDAGIGIAVSADTAAGTVKFANKAYGSGSGLSFSGNAFTAATGIFGTPAITDGVDVAGKINGVTGTAQGQQLTAAIGSSGADGLVVKVTGGGTGFRGTIDYTQGLSIQLDRAIGSLTDSATGLIAARTKGINQSITDIGKQRDVLTARLDTIQQRYLAQFNAMDSLVSKMNSTSNFLTQQLNLLSKSNTK